MRYKSFETTLALLSAVLTFSSCGYRLVGGNVSKGLKGRELSLLSVKNLTGEYGIEQDLVRSLKDGLLANGVDLKMRDEKADYVIDVIIKSIQFLPLAYRKGINVAYTYEYRIQISVDCGLLNSKTGGKRVFSITDEDIYFSEDSPASTEAKKRVAIQKVFERIVERFVRELSLGIQGI